MAYVKGCKFDVFVSYAHGPAAGGQRGDLLSRWTERFVSDLGSHLGIHLGTKDPTCAVEIWMDRELGANQGLTEVLKATIERSAIFLVVMSHFYLDSPWCEAELGWFASRVQSSNLGDRIFVARAFQTDDGKWPKALRDSRGYVFPGMCLHKPAKPGEFGEPHGWPAPLPEHIEYQEIVSRLAQQIARQLQAINIGSEESSRPPPAARAIHRLLSGKCIFLGHVHDTLADTWNDVRTRLTELGARVVPSPDLSLSDKDTLHEALEEHLKEAQALILAFNEYGGGGWPRGQQGGFLGLQIQRALERKVPPLIWNQTEDIAQVRRLDDQQFLTSILKDNLNVKMLRHPGEPDTSEFVNEVATILQSSNTPAKCAIIWSNVDSDDAIYRNFREIVLNAVGETERGAILPPCDRDGHLRFEALEESLSEADAVLIICFDQEWRWANRVLPELAKLCGSPSMRKAQIFIAGPQLRGAGRYDARGYRFHTVHGIDLDEIALKRAIKEQIIAATAA